MTFPKFLRVAVISHDALVKLTETEDGNYQIVDGGPDGQLIKLCAQALKFSYKVVPSPDGTWGKFVNGTWTGGIGLVHRNEADIGVSKFGVTLDRAEYIQYSYPYIIELFTFATQKPGLKTHMDAIIQPFSSEIWLAIFVTVIILSLFFALFQKSNLVESIQKVFEILISHSTKIKHDNIKSGLFLSAWILGSLFLSYGYVAVLLSFLTIPVLEKIPENIEELGEAVEAGTYKAMTYRGTNLLSGFLNDEREAIRDIVKHIESNKNFVPFNKTIILEVMQKEKMALISPDTGIKYLLQDEFYISHDFFEIQISAIIMSKSFCCKKEIDDFVHRISASGIYAKHVKDLLFLAGLKSKHPRSAIGNRARPLSLQDISGAFVLIITGHVFALISALIEIAYFNFFEKRMNQFAPLRSNQ